MKAFEVEDEHDIQELEHLIQYYEELLDYLYENIPSLDTLIDQFEEEREE